MEVWILTTVNLPVLQHDMALLCAGGEAGWLSGYSDGHAQRGLVLCDISCEAAGAAGYSSGLIELLAHDRTLLCAGSEAGRLPGYSDGHAQRGLLLCDISCEAAEVAGAPAA